MKPDLTKKLDATVKAATVLIKQSTAMKRIQKDIEQREKEDLAIQSAMTKGATEPEG